MALLIFFTFPLLLHYSAYPSFVHMHTKVSEISKRSSQKWKLLSADERAIWDEKAEKDKERYNQEKERYTGPWQVPWKRAKKVS